ncbi:hypothetical protein FIBSPDRAFT_952251 [Athelia psychrophila]|uniref:Uncharacterized protein n=1 Tax=Athelia psychrophila TaxID=1759441 RepID=A0A166LPJ0_9AGAM|nr:hypothetical protein FIBSPDRAFT_952251 [Fibularhizoctonia sp. CBS 109695]
MIARRIVGVEVVIFPEYCLQGIVDGKQLAVHGASHSAAHDRLSLRTSEEAQHVHRMNDCGTPDEISAHHDLGRT